MSHDCAKPPTFASLERGDVLRFILCTTPVDKHNLFYLSVVESASATPSPWKQEVVFWSDSALDDFLSFSFFVNIVEVRTQPVGSKGLLIAMLPTNPSSSHQDTNRYYLICRAVCWPEARLPTSTIQVTVGVV